MSVEFFWNNVCVFSLNSYHRADSVSWELLIKKPLQHCVVDMQIFSYSQKDKKMLQKTKYGDLMIK